MGSRGDSPGEPLRRLTSSRLEHAPSSPVTSVTPPTSVTVDQTVPAPAPRLRQHLPLAVGAVALVTLGAFENRAVGTALPTMVRELDAVSAFGLANAAPTASYLVALSLAGAWADRRGPVPALRAGVLLFAVAQLLVGLAASMPMVILGRTVSGVAEAALDMSLTVLVARTLPPVLRPRMFSLFAAAWVLPSVAGPAATGVVTDLVGWRWVFLGALFLLVPVWLLLRGAVRSATGPVAAAPPEVGGRSTAVWAAASAAFVFVLTLAGSELGDHHRLATLVVLLSAAGLAVSVARLLPAGTLRGRAGFPAVVAVRALVGAAFGGVGAFLPLLMTEVHGFGASMAGISLSITGVMWATGSWIQGRDHPWSRPGVLRAGLALMTLGLAGTSLLVVVGVAPWWGLLGWGLAGLGMGLTSPVLQLLTLDLSAEHEQGRNTGLAQTAASTSMALAFAFGGTLVALAAPHPGRSVFAVLIAVGTASALVALLVARRVAPSTRG